MRRNDALEDQEVPSELLAREFGHRVAYTRTKRVTLQKSVAIALGLGTSVANKLLLLTAVGTQMVMDTSDSFRMSLVLAQVGVLGAGYWSFDDRIYAQLVEWMKPGYGDRNTDA